VTRQSYISKVRSLPFPEIEVFWAPSSETGQKPPAINFAAEGLVTADTVEKLVAEAAVVVAILSLRAF
jgi:hypothetical protein